MYNMNDPQDMARYNADMMTGLGLGTNNPTGIGRVINDLRTEIALLKQRLAALESANESKG